jgi:hypothetical protein
MNIFVITLNNSGRTGLARNVLDTAATCHNVLPSSAPLIWQRCLVGNGRKPFIRRLLPKLFQGPPGDDGFMLQLARADLQFVPEIPRSMQVKMFSRSVASKCENVAYIIVYL